MLRFYCQVLAPTTSFKYALPCFAGEHHLHSSYEKGGRKVTRLLQSEACAYFRFNTVVVITITCMLPVPLLFLLLYLYIPLLTADYSWRIRYKLLPKFGCY